MSNLQLIFRCIDINECEIHGSKCEHFCVNSPGSYKCDCRPGFILANQTNCIDINECRARISCQYGCTMVNSRSVIMASLFQELFQLKLSKGNDSQLQKPFAAQVAKKLLTVYLSIQKDCHKSTTF